MKIVNEFKECDGWAVIVEHGGETLRLHSQERPKDTSKWASDAVANIEAARSIAEPSKESVSPTTSMELETAISIVKEKLSKSADARASVAISLLDSLKAADDTVEKVIIDEKEDIVGDIQVKS